jgi:transposase-like protein
MNTQKRYSPEFRERAIRLVEEQQKDGDSQWAAMQSILQKLGCTPETLRRCVRQDELQFAHDIVCTFTELSVPGRRPDKTYGRQVLANDMPGEISSIAIPATPHSGAKARRCTGSFSCGTGRFPSAIPTGSGCSSGACTVLLA